jgi:integrase
LTIFTKNIPSRELNDKCGFGKQGRSRFFTSHKLRKYFATTLEANGMPHLMTRWLMGHSIESLTNSYFKPDIRQMKNRYIEMLPFLSLEKVEPVGVETEDYKEL